MYSVDQFVIRGARADFRVGDSSRHLISYPYYIIEIFKSDFLWFGSPSSHNAIHERVQKAELQPVSTVSQIAVDEKVIHVNVADYWLYGACDSEANETLGLRLFSTTTKQTMR